MMAAWVFVSLWKAWATLYKRDHIYFRTGKKLVLKSDWLSCVQSSIYAQLGTKVWEHVEKLVPFFHLWTLNHFKFNIHTKSRRFDIMNSCYSGFCTISTSLQTDMWYWSCPVFCSKVQIFLRPNLFYWNMFSDNIPIDIIKMRYSICKYFKSPPSAPIASLECPLEWQIWEEVSYWMPFTFLPLPFKQPDSTNGQECNLQLKIVIFNFRRM